VLLSRIARVASALLAFAITAGSLSAPASAQTTTATATIRGMVLSSEQTPLVGATIIANGPATQSATTSADGSFHIDALPAGIYRLSVTKSGYAPLPETRVTVADGGSASVAVTLVQQTLSSLRTIGQISVNSRSATVLNTTSAAQVTVSGQTFYDRADIHVQNILEEQPGVELSRHSSGAPGSNTSIAIRGADPYETQVLIDGHPISGGTQGDYLVQFLNPLLLSDIEIDKGPGAFGNTIANQIGGRVNFRTPEITKLASGTFNAGYDSYNGSTLSARYSNTFGKVGFLVGFSRTGTPGYLNGTVLDVNADGPVGTGQIPNATINQALPTTELYDNKSELVKLAYNFSPTTTLTFGYLGSQSYVDYTGTLTTLEPVKIVGNGVACATCGAYNQNNGNGTGNSGMPSYNNPLYPGYAGQTVYASTTQDNLYLGNYETNNEPLFTADLRTSFGPGSLLGRFYAASISRIIADPQEIYQISQCDDPTCNFALAQANGDTLGGFNQQQLDILHGADFEYDLPIGQNSFALGYDTHADRSSSCSGADPSFPPSECSIQGVKTTSSTFSLRGNIHLNDRTTLDLGNYFSHTSYVGSRYDPRLGLVFRPTSRIALRASYGTGYAAPYANIVDHVSRKTYYSSTQTKPETSSSYNVGADVSLGGDAKFGIDVYNTMIHNRFAQLFSKTPGTFNGIAYNQVNGSINQANTATRGIEMTFAKSPRFGFGGSASLDLMRSYAFNTDFTLNQQGNYGNIADGAQTVGDPYTHGRAEVSYTTPKSVKIVFGMSYYGANNSYNEAGFAMFDAQLAAPLANGFKLSLAGGNLFNHDQGRGYGVYAYGFAPVQDASSYTSFNPQTLFFVPPRQITLQLSHPLGK